MQELTLARDAAKESLLKYLRKTISFSGDTHQLIRGVDDPEYDEEAEWAANLWLPPLPKLLEINPPSEEINFTWPQEALTSLGERYLSETTVKFNNYRTAIAMHIDIAMKKGSTQDKEFMRIARDFVGRLNLFMQVLKIKHPALQGTPQQQLESAADDAQTASRKADEAKSARDSACTELQNAEGKLKTAQKEVQIAALGLQKAENDRDNNKKGRKMENEKLFASLNAHKLWFNQLLWRKMTPPQITAMLGDAEHPQGAPLATRIEPEVIGVRDHYVALRWPFTPEETTARVEFERKILWTEDRAATRETVAIPTSGLFAEAVLGTSNAAEKLDLTRFWKWDDTTIPILPTAIQAMQQRRRERLEEARPQSDVAPTLQAEELPDMPAPARAALGAAVSAPLFRQLADSQRISDLLGEAIEQAEGLGETAQEEAQRNAEAYQKHIASLIPLARKALAQSSEIDPSSLGALSNALGDGELDVDSLLGMAAKLGLMK